MATTSCNTVSRVRFQVTPEIVLSVSSWRGKSGMYLNSVALVRNGKIDHESCVEIVREREDDARYIATDYATKLVADVLGECPSRFFRDAAL